MVQKITVKNAWLTSQKFCRPFARSTKLIFRALSDQYKDPVLAKTLAPQAKF